MSPVAHFGLKFGCPLEMVAGRVCLGDGRGSRGEGPALRSEGRVSLTDIDTDLARAERALSVLTSSGNSHIPSESMRTFRREPLMFTFITTPLLPLLLLLLDLGTAVLTALLLLLLLRCAELVTLYRPLLLLLCMAWIGMLLMPLILSLYLSALLEALALLSQLYLLTRCDCTLLLPLLVMQAALLLL